MFTFSENHLTSLGAEITTREIKQQPELWQEAFDYYIRESQRITNFLKMIKDAHEKVRVIFTGAGTSAYVGDTILPYLKEKGDEAHFEFQTVATTHLVSNPKSYFKAEIPTVLVSFARSGNSPESLASVELGKQLVNDFYQITITCAPDGKLAQHSEGDDKNLLLLMPSRSNDQGFAMTGSFTCMTLTALLTFDPAESKEKEAILSHIISMGNTVLAREEEIQAFVDLDFNRVIYLGSGGLAGLAREVQLKILELTAGKVATAFDSSLGFRHGPKSFVDDKSLVFVFVSNDAYTRKYDIDMLKELNEDSVAQTICGISVDGNLKFEGTNFLFEGSYAQVPDAYLALPYAMFGQAISLFTAVKVGNRPDTPSPSGTVNRVVKGVNIYSIADAE